MVAERSCLIPVLDAALSQLVGLGSARDAKYRAGGLIEERESIPAPAQLRRLLSCQGPTTFAAASVAVAAWQQAHAPELCTPSP